MSWPGGWKIDNNCKTICTALVCHGSNVGWIRGWIVWWYQYQYRTWMCVVEGLNNVDSFNARFV